LKQPELQAGRLSPFTVEAKNEWSCTSTPPKCLHGVNRDKFSIHNNDSNIHNNDSNSKNKSLDWIANLSWK
jgi:hypothetical protein